jgi:hypothetical protein
MYTSKEMKNPEKEETGMEEVSEKDSLERVHRLLAISICLLAFLMFSSWFLPDMITKSLVIIFVPLLITISYSII